MSYQQVFPTRWNDNDVYGHVNNTIYYAAMDTTINTWMIREAGFTVSDAAIALCVSSSCTYTASGSFPDTFVVALSAARVGSTSITWEIAISRQSDAEQLATGQFVHVFVDERSRRPTPIPAGIRAALDDL